MKITEKQIKGLNFHDSIAHTTEEDGRQQTRYTPTIRPLTLEDILSEREKAEGICFVTKDGKKYFWDRKTGKSTEANN